MRYSALLLSFIILFVSEIHSRAGRGSSYSGSSSSSSYGGSSSYSGSSSSSYSGSSSYSSGSSSYDDDDYSGSSYSSGPSFIKNLNLEKFMTWLRVNKDGTVDVVEKYYFKKLSYEDGFKREFDERPYPFQLTGSITASGAAAKVTYKGDHNPEIEIIFDDRKKKKQPMVTLKYRVKDAFVEINGRPVLLWPYELKGEAERAYFEIEMPRGYSADSAYLRFGSIFDALPFENDRLEMTVEKHEGKPAVETNSRFFWLKDLEDTGIELRAELKPGSMPVIRKQYRTVAFLHSQADYRLSLNEDSYYTMKGELTLRKLDKRDFKPELLLQGSKPQIKIIENGTVGDHFSRIYYQSNSENRVLSDEDWGRYLLFNRELSENKQSYSFDFTALRVSSDYKERRYFTVDLPLAVFPEKLDKVTTENNYSFTARNNAYAARSRVEIEVPEFLNADDLEVRLFRGSYGTIGYGFEYIEELPVEPVEKKGSLILDINRPLFMAEKYRLHISAPVEKFSSDGTWAYYKEYLAGNLAESPLYIYLALIGTLFALITVVAVIWFILRGMKKSHRQNLEREKKAAERIEKNNRFFAEKIQSSDPGFDLEKFLERVEYISVLIQKCWSDNRMQNARSFISQGLYNRFRIQLNMMIRQENLKNIVSDYEVTSLELKDYAESGPYQSLHVIVSDKAKDVTVSASASDSEVNEKLSETSPNTFRQVYSFTRRKSAETREGHNLLDGNCPSCGAEVENASDTNRCRYCGALFNSGDYDWVLTEITQMIEFRTGAQSRELEEQYGSAQVIEDRASYLFWQWLLARTHNDPAVIRRHATAEQQKNFSGALNYLAEPVIGAAELQKTAPAGETHLSADVLIKWSASFRKGTQPSHQQSVMRLVKRPENDASGFSDTGCPSCGGPLPDDYRNECEFCKSELPSKSSDWLLHKISD